MFHLASNALQKNIFPILNWKSSKKLRPCLLCENVTFLLYFLKKCVHFNLLIRCETLEMNNCGENMKC